MDTIYTLSNPTRRHAGAAVSALLLLGPVVTLWWVGEQAASWGAANATVAAWMLLFFWTPLAPFTFSAVALGDHRDRARMRGTSWLQRSFLLIPWMLLSPHSTARSATLANLVGVLAGVWYLLNYV